MTFPVLGDAVEDTIPAHVLPRRGQAASPQAAAPDERADIALLTGEPAHGIVTAALAAGGGVPPAPTVRVDAVHHRPGVGVSVVYLVEHGPAPARVSERIVASTAPTSRRDSTAGVAVLSDGQRSIRVWRLPDDPALPALRPTLDPGTLGSWLRTAERITIDLLTYRPTRRAVVAARTSERTVYAKVLPPRKADGLRHRHHLSPQAPEVIGTPAPGVVLIAQAPGSSLAQALASGDPAQVPSPADVLRFVRELPVAASELEARPSWVDRLDFHAEAARVALPEREAEVEAIQRRIASALARTEAGPVTVTHGDLHVANLFVDKGVPVAVIDVDSLGPGHLIDDLATLLAHLLVLPALAPDVYPEVSALARSWFGEFARHVDPDGLRARTAAVLISLIAGAAHPQAVARLDLALDLVPPRREQS